MAGGARVGRQRSESHEEPNQIPLRLSVAPSVCREHANVEQVRTCPPQQSETGHRSAGARGTEIGEDALEARALGDATLLAFD